MVINQISEGLPCDGWTSLNQPIPPMLFSFQYGFMIKNKANFQNTFKKIQKYWEKLENIF